MSNSRQLPGIPQTVTGRALINTVNDRLRRISLVLGTATTGATGARGAPGASSPGGGGSAALQHVTLAANAALAISTRSGNWVYIADNPTSGLLVVTPDATYAVSTLLRIDPGTRMVANFFTMPSGNTTLISVLFKQPILP